MNLNGNSSRRGPMPAPFAPSVGAIPNGAVSSVEHPMNGFNIGGANSVSGANGGALQTMSSVKNSSRKINIGSRG